MYCIKNIYNNHCFVLIIVSYDLTIVQQSKISV